ncbi:MAG: NFACT RNA binding domain-containing protein [Armatimonadota bacterium]|nr:NFACT RNA binding domain-containing protein [Armatimonadota bacterium]
MPVQPAPGFDSVVLSAVLRELVPLAGGRVVRITQTGKMEVTLHIRTRGTANALLLSVDPETARLHLVSMKTPTFPLSPFAQLLRRHLEGARFLHAEQPPFERIALLHFETLQGPMELVAEFMGRHSNLILVHKGTILGAMKTVPAEVSRPRQIYPGIPYLPPPPSRTPTPEEICEEELLNGLKRSGKPLWKALPGVVRGIGPSLAKELMVRCGLDPNTSASTLQEGQCILGKLREVADLVTHGAYSPRLYLAEEIPVAFTPFPFASLSHLNAIPATMSASVEAVYNAFLAQRQFTEERKSLRSSIEQHLRRLSRAASDLQKTLEEAQESDRLRTFGELLLAYSSQIPPGASEAVVPGYSEGEEVRIPLDPRLCAVENAQAYFKRYSKLRAARQVAEGRLKEVQAETAYLDSLLVYLDQATTLDDLAEIRKELEEEGYLRKSPPPHRTSGKLRAYSTGEGFTILVGRSNRENDHLTFHIARPSDLWFHARDVPGSHVILQTGGRTPSSEAIEVAAQVAAYFSKARGSGHVLVDYTERRYVRRPSRRQPGMVLYNRERSIWVTPALPPQLAPQSQPRPPHRTPPSAP